MASLTVRTQNFQAEGPASSRRQGPYHYHSRLPTPGTSTRPFGAFDGPQADDGSRDVYFRHDVERRDSYHRESQPKDSHHNLLPSSPPYQLSDSQRPLLPPLMTVLGDAIRSPPPTPQTKNVSLQPLPCEPTISAGTYKPPSLYPNKKLRTDFRFEPVAPITDPYTFYSSGRLPTPFERPYCDISEPRRRPSYQHGSTRRTQPSTSQMPGQSPRQDKVPTGVPSFASNYCIPSVRPFEGTDVSHSPRLENGRPFSQRPNDHRDAYAPMRPYERGYSYGPDSQVSSPSIPGCSERHSTCRPTRDDVYGWSDASEAYPESQSPYFVPNHYDYKHGKTRKRSNLPKQSTEIMKNWFDKNISNPYPTEEQKAMFSNVTGISMTQVSNWFINHRRRYPELRDKREKGRGQDYDM